jgi:hypothetical protein
MIVPIQGVKQGEGGRGYADRFSEPEALILVGERDRLTAWLKMAAAEPQLCRRRYSHPLAQRVTQTQDPTARGGLSQTRP